MKKIETEGLHFDITCVYNENGKHLYQIIKEHFLLYLKSTYNEEK